MLAALGKWSAWAKASARTRCEREGHWYAKLSQGELVAYCLCCAEELPLTAAEAAAVPAGQKFRKEWVEMLAEAHARIEREPWRLLQIVPETLARMAVTSTAEQLLRMMKPPERKPPKEHERRISFTFNVVDEVSPVLERVKVRIGYVRMKVFESDVLDHLEEFYRGARGEGVGFRLGPAV